jgi:hypothetical protein
METLDLHLQVFPEKNPISILNGFIHQFVVHKDGGQKYTFSIKEELEIDPVTLRQNRSNFWKLIPDGLANPEAILPGQYLIGMVLYLFGQHSHLNLETVNDLQINVSKVQATANNFTNPKQELITAINVLWPYINIKDE